jgi:hypothetical protein
MALMIINLPRPIISVWQLLVNHDHHFMDHQNTQSRLSAAAAEVSAVKAMSYAQLDRSMDDLRLDYRFLNWVTVENGS